MVNDLQLFLVALKSIQLPLVAVKDLQLSLVVLRRQTSHDVLQCLQVYIASHGVEKEILCRRQRAQKLQYLAQIDNEDEKLELTNPVDFSLLFLLRLDDVLINPQVLS